MATVDENLIHIWQRENAVYLNNRISTRCRGNSFRPVTPKGLHFAQAQSPARASRPAVDVPASARSIGDSFHRRARRQTEPLQGHARLRARAIVDLALRYREDSRRSHRIRRRFHRANYFWKIELFRSTRDMRHSRALILVPDLKYRSLQSALPEVSVRE